MRAVIDMVRGCDISIYGYCDLPRLVDGMEEMLGWMKKWIVH